MARLLLCLPVCLLLAPAYPSPPLPEYSPPPPPLKAPDGAKLPAPDPITFLEKCLEKYDREIQAYSLIFRKRERIGDKVQNLEVIEVHFKEKPHSVFFNWLQGERRAKRVVYVEGENNGKMVAMPAGALALAGIVERDLDSPDAKQSGRYTIAQFGLKKAMQRVLGNWKLAKQENALHLAYLGVHKVAEAGDRPCHVIQRTKYARPEDDGVTELIIYVDTETLLQVGTVLKGADGQLIAEYYFRDIRLNPQFRPNQFTRAALK